MQTTPIYQKARDTLHRHQQCRSLGDYFWHLKLKIQIHFYFLLFLFYFFILNPIFLQTKSEPDVKSFTLYVKMMMIGRGRRHEEPYQLYQKYINNIGKINYF